MRSQSLETDSSHDPNPLSPKMNAGQMIKVSRVASTSPQEPYRPCALCTSKGFQSNHFALKYRCGVAKLSSPDILQIIFDSKTCPSCAYVLNHPSNAS